MTEQMGWKKGMEVAATDGELAGTDRATQAPYRSSVIGEASSRLVMRRMHLDSLALKSRSSLALDTSTTKSHS